MDHNYAAANIESDATHSVAAFLKEIGEISHKYGLGIAGDPVLFILEDSDREREYRADSESKITFV